MGSSDDSVLSNADNAWSRARSFSPKSSNARANTILAGINSSASSLERIFSTSEYASNAFSLFPVRRNM